MANFDSTIGTGGPASGNPPEGKESVRDTASRAGRETSDKIKQEAQEMGTAAKDKAQSMLKEQKSAAADEIGGIAKALRKAAAQLNEQDQHPASDYASRAAGGLDRLSDTLRNRDLDSLTGEVQDLARRQPGVFLGGAVAAGFLVARFLKSSSKQKHRDMDFKQEESSMTQARVNPPYGGGPDANRKT